MKFGHFKSSESTAVDSGKVDEAIMNSGSNRFTVTNIEYFDELDESDKRSIQLTKTGATLAVEGVEKIGEFEDVFYCPSAESNSCSISNLCDLGYTKLSALKRGTVCPKRYIA